MEKLGEGRKRYNIGKRNAKQAEVDRQRGWKG